LGGCGGGYQNEGEQVAKTLNPLPSWRLRASIVFPNRPPFESSVPTRSEMAKSPSNGRSKRRAVPELTACRCGVLFLAKKGKKEKRFCSQHCAGQHVVETRQLRDLG
jgi:hypothetical protein